MMGLTSITSLLLSGAFLLDACLQVSSGSGDCAETDIAGGFHVQNCSNKGLSKLPDIPDHAEVLDFSRNQLQQVPIIPESRECHEDAECEVKDINNHCRVNISFSRNSIVSIHADAFRGLMCLETLDLSFNQIKSEIFHVALFQNGLYYLQNLNLRGNPLGNLPDNIISQPFMHNLRRLDLSHCDLHDIGKDSVDDFGELKVLNLSFNSLKTIHQDTFKGLTNLEVLDLTENQLSFFPEHVFGDLFSLKELRLAYNQISGFHQDAFYMDSDLTILNLENNKLTSIPYVAVDKLLQLETLDLSKNPIESVKPGVQTNKAKHLILNNMAKLRTLEAGAFSSFSALETLTITGSKSLKAIQPMTVTEQFKDLRHVSLEDNGLFTLAEDAFPWKQLTTLKLSGNPWICDDRLEWMISASSISGPVLCSSPAKLRGLDIRALHSSQLARYYSIAPLTSLISLLLCIPLIALVAYLAWKRRRFCPCAGHVLKGRYVSVFTRDIDEEGEDRVAVELKVNVNRLKTISNGNADDTKPFMTMEAETAVRAEDDDEEI